MIHREYCMGTENVPFQLKSRVFRIKTVAFELKSHLFNLQYVLSFSLHFGLTGKRLLTYVNTSRQRLLFLI
jgi:hypothetical protein